MYKILDFPYFDGFLKHNLTKLQNHSLEFYHINSFIKRMLAEKLTYAASYNVIDDYGGDAIAIDAPGVYYLYSLKWSDAILDGLLTKIQLTKYTKRVHFCGTKDLIIALFEKAEVDFSIYKDRIVYECYRTLPLLKKPVGCSYFSEESDVEIVAGMIHRYGIEEWGVRPNRDLNFARSMAAQSIENEILCHWEIDGKITTIAQLIDSDTNVPIIGSLYTNVEDRKNGYACFLTHEITSQLLSVDDVTKVAIISDATDPITNKMFSEIGFKEVCRYIDLHSLKETL